MGCLTSQELTAFSHGLVPADSRNRVVAHLSNCASCRSALHHLSEQTHLPAGGSVGSQDVTIESRPSRSEPTNNVVPALRGCLSPQEIREFGIGSMPADLRRQANAHITDCASCRGALLRFQAQNVPPPMSGSIGPADATLDAGQSLQRVWPAATTTAARIPVIEGYQIIGVLGQGGMGIVYKAMQTKLNRMVALKVLPAMVGSANPAAVQRFRREATAAARLHHTNIIPIYDFGESADAYYYAMEYITGKPLDVVIRSVSQKFTSPPTAAELAHAVTELDLPIPVRTDSSADGATSSLPAPSVAGGMRGRTYYRQIARWMADAAEALHYAHSHGVIHRDIKPANLILSGDGRIMVADFGLAKSAGDNSVTMTGALLGTLRYLSPEQAMAKRMRVDHRTDVYSLGATMYELLTFQPAYPGMDDKEILGAIMTRDPAPLRKINANVPAELDIICMKCMEKSPDARYETARAMADDLRRYINDLPIVARRPSVVTRAVKFTRRHKLPVVAATAVVLVSASAFLWQREAAARQREEQQKRLAQISALHDSAQSLALVNQWKRAEADLRSALAIDPDHIVTLLTLAWLKLEYFKAQPQAAGLESQEDVIAACDHILRLDPNESKALAYKGTAQRRLGRHSDAIASLERVLKLEPAKFETWSNLGSLYVVIKDLEKGAEYLRKGAELAGVAQNRWQAATWRNLAMLDWFLKDQQVVKHLDSALACDRIDATSWLLRARVGMELKGHINLKEALDDAKHADRLSEFKNARAKRIRAMAHLAYGQSSPHLADELPEAITQAKAAIELQDEPAVNHLIITIAAAKMGNMEEARQHLATAEKLWPAELRTAGSFQADAGTGDLWIDSAEERLRFAEQARSLLE